MTDATKNLVTDPQPEERDISSDLQVLLDAHPEPSDETLRTLIEICISRLSTTAFQSIQGLIDGTEPEQGGKWGGVRHHLESLYHASDCLNELFPGRKFTLDGHLVGSLGEVIAEYMFDLRLLRASTLGHDAISRDGRPVEVKFTQRKSVGIRHPPDRLLVFHRPQRGKLEVVYNGPGQLAWENAGKPQKNGQRNISLKKLAVLDGTVPRGERLPRLREPPI